jgi:hypothetical protein
VTAILASLALAVILLAATSSYSAWVSSSQHRNSCTSRGVILDAFDDVLIAAQAQTDDDPAKSAAEKMASDKFVASSIVRLNRARC